MKQPGLITRLRALHKPRTERPNSCCVQCGIVWPCPTSRLLDDAEPVTQSPIDRSGACSEWPHPAVGRAALRDRIAEALAEKFTRDGNVTDGMRVLETTDDPDVPAARRVRPVEAADAVLGVLPEPNDRAVVLSNAEQTMLTYALDQAQQRIWSEEGFTDEDQAAVDSLRRLAVAVEQPCRWEHPHPGYRCEPRTASEQPTQDEAPGAAAESICPYGEDRASGAGC